MFSLRTMMMMMMTPTNQTRPSFYLSIFLSLSNELWSRVVIFLSITNNTPIKNNKRVSTYIYRAVLFSLTKFITFRVLSFYLFFLFLSVSLTPLVCFAVHLSCDQIFCFSCSLFLSRQSMSFPLSCRIINPNYLPLYLSF